MKRLIQSLFTILVLTASTAHADIAPWPQIILPPVPKESPVPLILAGVAVAIGVVVSGIWIARRGRTKQ